MPDIPLPTDIGRIRHLTAQMHKSEDDAGDPIPETYLLGADGARGHTWYDPADLLVSSSVYYNVQDYGAVGDGTTDDTAAIVATFDAADATGGGVVYFPPTANYYKITSLITRTGTSRYHVLGGGTRYGPARVHQATSNTGAFKFAPSSGTANRLLGPIVQNLTISGAGGASSGRGLEFANDGHVESCFVYGFYVGIFVGTESYYSNIHRTTITDCDFAGIQLSGTNNATIDKCRLTGLFSTGSAPIGTLVNGIVVTSGFNTRIVNSSIEYFTQYGIAVEGGGPIEITGNYFETQQSTTGFAHLWLGNTTTTYGAWVVSNYFQGDAISGFNAIKLDNAVAFHILGNRFGVNAAIGIAHTGGSSLGFCWGNTNTPTGTFTLPSDTITTPGGSTLTVQDEGTPLATAATTLNFAGAGVVATGAGATKTITIAGGAAALDDLTDVVIAAAAANNDLRFDGTNWVNTAGAWRPLMDGSGAVITDGATGEAIVAYS